MGFPKATPNKLARTGGRHPYVPDRMRFVT